VLGRVIDSSESDSSLLAFFEGEREESNKKGKDSSRSLLTSHFQERAKNA
jgi:hypothetical protein